MTKKNKKLTIKDFHLTRYICWGELEDKLGKKRYKELKKWLIGQGTHKGGIWESDLIKFLGE